MACTGRGVARASEHVFKDVMPCGMVSRFTPVPQRIARAGDSVKGKENDAAAQPGNRHHEDRREDQSIAIHGTISFGKPHQA